MERITTDLKSGAFVFHSILAFVHYACFIGGGKMPKAPRFDTTVEQMPGSVFSPLADEIAQFRGELYPLHIGDSWRTPPEAAEARNLAHEPDLYRYADTRGILPLREAIVEKLEGRNQIQVDLDSVLVCAGATGALACAVGSVVSPGDEVLILAPYWPLFRGIVQSFRGVPVDIPFYDRCESESQVADCLQEQLTSRTVALYVSTPSNPTGRVLDEDTLHAIAVFAQKNNLWLLSDEVYEDLIYSGEHISIARYAPERTLSVFSFSKSYAMAGNRVGYIAGPAAAISQARKIGTHTAYQAPTLAQWSALYAFRNGDAWLRESLAHYREAAHFAAQALGVVQPAGSTFLFLNIGQQLSEGDLWQFLKACLQEDGVLLAPGEACGRDYATWVRLCYTAVAPQQLQTAVTALARRLGRASAAAS